jgi:hypothetical protein
MKIPVRYLPPNLSIKDKKKQVHMLLKSRKLYKKHTYFTRKSLPSYKTKTSNHITRAKKIYNIDNVIPNKELSRKTGCSLEALKKIVNKGEGAYFSSGSRPNQTAQSWGYARLGSAITGQKAAAVDFAIIERGCKKSGKAYKLAKQSKQKYGSGHSTTRKVNLTSK